MKKLLSLTLATILCLSLLPVAFSVCIYEESEGGDIDTANLLPCIESIVYDADIWGLDGKLDSLYIGKPIHTYEYLNTGVLRETDFVYYPVFSEGVPLLLILEKEDGFTQATQAFIDVLSNYVSDSVAIIYDQDETYILSNSGKATVACSYEVVSDERGNIADMRGIAQSGEVKWTTFIAYQALPPLENVAQPCYDPFHPTVTLNVPTILQGQYDNICWAACIASIGNYLTGKSYTAVEIAQNKFGTAEANFNQQLAVSASIDLLYEIYGVEYSNKYTQRAPTGGEIYTNLSDGYPLVGGWESGSWKHATVIRGMDYVNKILYIMDPEQGYVTARKVTDSTQKTYGYYSFIGSHGQPGYLIGYASKN